MINYSRFLSRFQIQVREVDSSWMDAITRRVCEKLYGVCGANLEEAYKRFDTNEDGFIEFDEFAKTLKNFDLGLSDLQIYELMRSVDSNDDAKVDFKEFSQRFEVVFKMVRDELQSSGSEEANDVWSREALTLIGQKLYSLDSSLEEGFRRFDKNGKGEVSTKTFISVLEGLGLSYTQDEAQCLFAITDTNKSGTIDYKEFVAAFEVTDTNPKGEAWKQGIVQQVANVLYQHRVHLKAAFRMFDANNNGKISSDEFSKGMNAMNALLRSPLSSVQIDELRLALDRDGDGFIDYKEFFNGFSIADTALRPNLLRRGSSSSYMDLHRLQQSGSGGSEYAPKDDSETAPMDVEVK